MGKRDLKVLHPLPRVDEITPDVDEDPRAAYFKQTVYGMYARMALIFSMLMNPQYKRKSRRRSLPTRWNAPTQVALPRRSPICRGFISKQAICSNANTATAGH